MRLVISGQEFYFDSKETATAHVFEKIMDISKTESLVFSHMVIDGVEIYENIEAYLESHFETIELAEAIFNTVSELIHDILMSTGQYINRAIPLLQELSEEYYKAPNQETWVKFGQLLEGIQWFQQTAAFIKENQDSISHLQIDEKIFDFTQETSMLEEAVEQQDFILLGDIIQYEILSKFETIANQLPNITSNEVIKHDLN
ncbi:hypothetical protein M4D58_05955 [Brevibacillus borstelensis]|uniref:hypothetical protein n=1 Tax=Brevibacillus borstelensis TaxID=45462 RepID=UPI00203ACBF4|nr:hypothetical protein [Brevibacillus borstelensis]MCM3590169.1 hypothetical protein [Brevibacillus borstelensis]